MSRTTGVLAALLTVVTASALTSAVAWPAASVAPAAGPAAARSAPEQAALPREIRGGVELTLADGDLLRVWAAMDNRTVWAKRRDSVAGTWGPRRTVLRKKNVFCGGVDARTANGAVAVLAQCDRHGYAEDQAPTASRAIWSPDGVTWSSYTLDGEAYEEPGISPDGRNAVWPQHGRYVTRTDAGFAEHRVVARGQEYTVTATITDTAQVSFMYGAQVRGRCGLVVQTRTGDATPVRQDLALASACSDSAFANVDSNTAWFGDTSSPAQRAVISRVDPTSPWAISAVAPATAPGLYQTWRALPQTFVTAPGSPLFAVGGSEARTVQAQTYDPVAQSWNPPVVIHTSDRRCRWSSTWAPDPLDVVIADLTCGRQHVVLTTSDGTTWQALTNSRRPLGVSPGGQYVALASSTRTWVVSRERGVVELPIGTQGRCDVVVPDGPDAAVLLTSAGRHRGWPTVLKSSSADGWGLLSRADLPTFDSECRRVAPIFYETPLRYGLFGGRSSYAVRIVERKGTWTAEHSRAY